MAHTEKYYESKGFDEKTAKYFASGRKKIMHATANPDFTLLLQFDNGEERIYNVKPLLKKNTVFEQFGLWENFARVYVDDNHCVAWDIAPNVDSNKTWNNKVDLDPDSCYINSVAIDNVQ